MRVLLFLFIALPALAQEPATFQLMPVPAQMRATAGKFRISSGFSVSVKADGSDTTLYRAVNRAYQAFNRRTVLLFGQQYILPAENIPHGSPGDATLHGAVEIAVRSRARMTPGVDESYTLDVETAGVRLTAANTIGALRGLETLIQLCAVDDQGYYLPCVSISDKPRFRWRGLMIDVARHFIPVDEIKRNIEAMALVKMNVLHWHLTDDEGFRVESKLFPLLQQKGSNGDYYSQAQVKEIIAYAADRGIMIVPEFDMPGHSQSWFAGYPELASQPGPYRPGPRMQWQNEHPDPNRPKGGGLADMVANLEAPTFDATNDKVYTFLDRFVGEMTALFPSGYVHIGADENNGLAWKLNPAISTWMKAHGMQTMDELQRYFVNRVHEILARHHREMIGWEEIYNEKLPKDAIVHKWIPAGMGIIQSHGTPAEFAAHGYRTLISEGFYLDVFMPAYIHYNNPAVVGADAAAVLGGEAAQWTEQADYENISGRIWPRAGAVAERLWSPAAVSDVDDMYRRLFALSRELDGQGLQHLSNYDRALRRIANGSDVSPIRVLADVLTPIKGYRKMISNFMKGPAASYQTTPLTAVSDIVFVDSETQREFRRLVKAWLEAHDREVETRIRNWLVAWRDNDVRLQPLFAGNKRLAEVRDHSRNLSLAAAIGLEVLERVDKGVVTDTLWVQQQVAALDGFSKVHGDTEIAVIAEIVALVNGRLAAEPVSYKVF